MVRVSVSLIAASAVATAVIAAPREVTPIVARGAEVAQARCAICHAVALETRSPNRDAPLFRVLSRLYSARDIQTKLTAISEHGHFEMPALALREDEIEDVAAYIESLEGRQPDDRPPPKDLRVRHRGQAQPAQWITSAAKRSISSYCGLI